MKITHESEYRHAGPTLDTDGKRDSYNGLWRCNTCGGLLGAEGGELVHWYAYEPNDGHEVTVGHWSTVPRWHPLEMEGVKP